jgi:arthrofactin-type cyclic lipopeptide synthetase B
MPANAVATLIDLFRRGGLTSRQLARVAVQLRQLDAVSDAVVVPRLDRDQGLQLLAYIVPSAAAPLSFAALRRELARTLPVRLLPTAYIVMDALSHLPDGTVDRACLPPPEGAALGMRLYQAPRGRLEQAIAARWQDLLGVPEVSRTGHFFELGGHSSLAVRFVHGLRQELGADIAMRDLLREPRLHRFAQLVDGRLGRGRAPAGAAAATEAPALASARLQFA